MRNFRFKVRRELLPCDCGCDTEKGKVPDPYVGVKLFHARHGCPKLTEAISDADGLPWPDSRILALFTHCPTGYCSYCEGDCVKPDDHCCDLCAEEFRPGEGVKFPCQRIGHVGHQRKHCRCEKCGLKHDPSLRCDRERDMQILRIKEKRREDRRLEQIKKEEKEAEEQRILENLTPEQARYRADVAECANVMIENGTTDIAGLSGGYKHNHDLAALDLDSVTSVCS